MSNGNYLTGFALLMVIVLIIAAVLFAVAGEYWLSLSSLALMNWFRHG